MPALVDHASGLKGCGNKRHRIPQLLGNLVRCKAQQVKVRREAPEGGDDLFVAAQRGFFAGSDDEEVDVAFGARCPLSLRSEEVDAVGGADGGDPFDDPGNVAFAGNHDTWYATMSTRSSRSAAVSERKSAAEFFFSLMVHVGGVPPGGVGVLPRSIFGARAVFDQWWRPLSVASALKVTEFAAPPGGVITSVKSLLSAVLASTSIPPILISMPLVKKGKRSVPMSSVRTWSFPAPGLRNRDQFEP